MSSSKSTASAPKPTEIQRVHAEHVKEHCGLPLSTLERDLGSERAMVREYAGRVVYELIQNALDRASELILVQATESNGRRQLLVGNDGLPVTVHERRHGKRSDFHSLCSLHSSTKSASTSVGNKGVGFRSTFSASPRVNVFSRDRSRGWWKLDLKHPVHVEDLPADMPDRETVIRRMEDTGGAAPSFYYPSVQVGLDSVPIDGDDLTTLVVLDDVGELAWQDVTESLRALGTSPLFFLRGRSGNASSDGLQIVLRRDGGDVCRTLKTDGWAIAQRQIRDGALLDSARSFDLDLEQIEVMVAVPLAPAADGAAGTSGEEDQLDREAGLFYAYLPTEQGSGYGAHVHADFYLSNSRRNVVFTGKEGPARYNRALLEVAADLLVNELWTRGDVARKADFWRCASPARASDPTWRKLVHKRLFPERRDRSRWRALVDRSFAGAPRRSVQDYQEFWDAVDRWAEAAYRTRSGWAWGETRKTFVEALRGTDGPAVLPVLDEPAPAHDAVVHNAVSVPPVTAKGGSREAVVFLRQTAGEQPTAFPPLPDWLLQNRIVVTTFKPRSVSEQEAGLTRFSALEALSAIPVEGLEDDADAATSVLMWALKVACAPSEASDTRSLAQRGHLLPAPSDEEGIAGGGTHGSAWGLVADQVEYRELARNRLAWLAVPVEGGGFAPARDVFAPLPEYMEDARNLVDEVPGLRLLDCERLRSELGDDADLARRFLGIPPCPRIGVVSRGGEKLRFGFRFQPGALSAPARRALFHLLDSARGDYLKHLHVRMALDHVRGVLNDVLLQVGSAAVAPVEELKLKVPWQVDDDLIAPDDVWLVKSRGGFRTHLLARQEADPGARSWLLQFLGASDFSEAAPEHRVVRALHMLQERYEAPSPDDARELTAAYRRLFGLLPSEGKRMAPRLWQLEPAPGERATLGWSDPGSDVRVVYPHKGYGGYLSCFPGLQVSVLRAEDVTTDLGLVQFKPELILRPVEGGEFVDKAMRTILSPHLGALLAIGDALSPRSLEDEEMRRRWQTLRFRKVKDAWLEPWFDGEAGEPIGRDDRDEALYWKDRHEIVFDTESFAPIGFALSEALMENRLVALQAERYLAIAEGAGLSYRRSVLRKMGVTEADLDRWNEIARSWTIEPDDEPRLLLAIEQALVQFGELKAPLTRIPLAISSRDFQEITLPDATEEEMAQALRTGCGAVLPGGQQLAPSIDMVAIHRRTWTATKTRCETEVLVERALRRPEQEWTDDLRDAWRAEWAAFEPDLDRLGFSAEAATRAFIEASPSLGIAEEEGRRGRAEAWSRGAIPLMERPRESVAELVVKVCEGKPSAPLAPETEETRRSRQRQQVARGQGAEEGVMALELPRVNAWLADREKRGEALAAIKAALSEAGALASGFAPGRPDKWMQVSGWWGNAGFDILTLKEQGGVLQPLRIETKRSSGKKPQIHLSENERIRALHYLSDAVLGTYALWVVLGPGQVIDATRALSTALTGGSARACDELRRAGLESDGWIMAVSLP